MDEQHFPDHHAMVSAMELGVPMFVINPVTGQVVPTNSPLYAKAIAAAGVK